MGRGSLNNKKPCPTCGKNKKYKFCCKDLDLIKERGVPKKVIEGLLEKENKVRMQKKELEAKGIYINYVNPIEFKGQKVWALGNRVYFNNNPHQTFHEFIVEVLLKTLGEAWYREQVQKNEEEQHFVLNCLKKFNKWKIANSLNPKNKISDNLWLGSPDGWTRSLLSLAFDICSLTHTNKLPDTIINRLKSIKGYQGARYEIAISAIFARLGCDIRFLDEDEKMKKVKHCEFVAIHKETNVSVGVEVKSRHRSGVIHQTGILNEKKALKADVGGLLNKALAQNPNNMSFMVFIDLNSPLTPNIEMENKPWFKDIRKIIDKQKTPTPENPDLYNAIIFTNYSYHYQTEKESDSGEHLAIIPIFPKYPLPSIDFINMLSSALNSYGNVPHIDKID